MSALHDAFCLGTLQWMSYPPARYGYVEPVRRLCADAFFGALELGYIPDEGERRQVRDLLRAANLRVFYGAHPRLLGEGLNPNSLDEGERALAERVLLEAVDEAAFLGAEGLAFLAGRWTPEGRESMLEQLVRTSVAVCRRAADRGMKVTLEVFDYDVDKAVLIGPAPLAARYARMVRERCDNFGLLVDLSHIPITHEDASGVVATLSPYIDHLHIGNTVLKPGAPAYGDKHPRFGFPDGVNDAAALRDFFTALWRAGLMQRQPQMVLSTEVSPQPGEDADAVLAGSKRAMREAWRMFRAQQGIRQGRSEKEGTP